MPARAAEDTRAPPRALGEHVQGHAALGKLHPRVARTAGAPVHHRSTRLHKHEPGLGNAVQFAALRFVSGHTSFRRGFGVDLVCRLGCGRPVEAASRCALVARFAGGLDEEAPARGRLRTASARPPQDGASCPQSCIRRFELLRPAANAVSISLFPGLGASGPLETFTRAIAWVSFPVLALEQYTQR